MSELQAINSVFNIEIEKIDPNPDQPRKHFQEEALRDLAESIRRYGVMQPITVVRREQETSEGGLATRYEIVAGERRWRASVIAGMSTIPAIIREVEETEQDRFELSILENLQREDLNPVDKARSFQRLSDEFGMRHAEIADRLGKSREYVTNSMRLLELPNNILDVLAQGEISEGHTRPMLTLRGHPDELQVLFNEIKTKHLTVRQAEQVAKNIMGKGGGVKHSRRSMHNPQQQALDPEMQDLQEKLSHSLGTSVSIDKRDKGGKLTIDFFSRSDLQKLLDLVGREQTATEVSFNTPTQEGEAALQDNVSAIPHHEAMQEAISSQDDIPRANLAKPVHGTEAPREDIITTQVSDTALPTDFIGGGKEVQSKPIQALEGDFEITRQKATADLDDSLAHRKVNQVPAHEAAEARTIEIREDEGHVFNQEARQVSGTATQHQQEIDAIIKEQSPHDHLQSGSGRVSLDLGEMNFTEAQYNQDVINQANNKDESLGVELSANNIQTRSPQVENNTTLTQEQNQSSNTQSHQVSEVSHDFVPNNHTEEGVSTLDSEVQTGAEFLPPQEPSKSNELEHNQQTKASTAVFGGAETGMGGLGEVSPEKVGSQNPSAHGQVVQEPYSSQAPQESPQPDSTRSHEKYPQGDPYRLDNFSI